MSRISDFYANGNNLIQDDAENRLKYQGEDYIVRLVAREDQNGNLFYDHEFTDIKKLVLRQPNEREHSTTSPHQLIAKIATKIENEELSDENLSNNANPGVYNASYAESFTTEDTGTGKPLSEFHISRLLAKRYVV